MALVTDNMTSSDFLEGFDDIFHLKETIRLTLTWNNILLCVRLLGIVLNVLALLVWTSKEMKSVTSRYLISIVGFDLVYLVSYVISNILNICNVCLAKPKLWVTDLVLMGAINFGLCGSILTTVIVSFERYIAIAYPFKIKFICTTRVASIMAVLSFCVIITYVTLDSVHALDMYIPLPPALGLKDVLNADNATLSSLGNYTFILFSCVYFTDQRMFHDFPLTQNILVYIVPSGLLLVLNILIIKSLRTAESFTSSRNPAAELAKLRLIKSVVAISCMSLIAYPTSFLMFFISQYYVTSDAFLFSMMMFTEDTVHALNSSINCLFYCLIGKRFRTVFAKIVFGGFPRRRYARPQRAPVYVISSNDKPLSTRQAQHTNE